MTATLKIADNLSLGLDAVTQTFAILAQRRKGKTYTASVIAEEMVRVGQPWVALDPTGAWWGLRAGKDGGPKGGLPVIVLGGQHGDLPLERTAGAVIADLVVDEPRHYVLDLSAFDSREAERQFATAFAERFYRRKAKNPDAIHLFVDEADVFVPQQAPSGDKRLLGAFEAIVRRGGIRGIGTTLISQRAAVVNKNVLEQIDVLIVLRTVGPRDRAALKGYIEAHGSDEERAELMSSVASLGLGEAWVWEPGADPPLFNRVQIRERRTYNSSATPKAGERIGAVALADVDLQGLAEAMAATVEKADNEDPVKLRKVIAELRRELVAKPDVEPEVREVSVLEDRHVDHLRDAAQAVVIAGGDLQEAAAAILERLNTSPPKPPPPTARRGGSSPPPASEAGTGRVPPSSGPAASPEGLGKQPMKMLEVLVSRHPMPLTRTQWATFSGYSLRSSSWSKSVGDLTRAGLVWDGPDEGYRPTDEGFAVFGGEPPPPATPEEVRAQWRASLKGPQAVAFFDALVDAHPGGLDRDDLNRETGYSKSSSSFSSTLGLLKRNKLLDERDGVLYASEDLFR